MLKLIVQYMITLNITYIQKIIGRMLSLVSLWMLCVIYWDSILSKKILFFQSFVYSLPIHLNFECKVYNHIFTGHESKFYSETEPKFQHQLGNFVTKMKFTLENLISKVVDFSFSTSHQCSFHVIFFSISFMSSNIEDTASYILGKTLKKKCGFFHTRNN